jgi:hypothetical protein
MAATGRQHCARRCGRGRRVSRGGGAPQIRRQRAPLCTPRRMPDPCRRAHTPVPSRRPQELLAALAGVIEAGERK